MNDRKKDIEGNNTDIDPISISSVTHNLSPTDISNSSINNTKKEYKRNAEDKVAPIISSHEKRPRMVSVSDISFAQNPVSAISLDRKSVDES